MSSSFLSKGSSKYEVDQFEIEKEDKDLAKSQFESSSSDSSEDEEEKAQVKSLKNKLSFLRKQQNVFSKEEKPEVRRNTERVVKGTLDKKEESKRRGTLAAYDIPNKLVKNTEGYYDKKGWILKKATSTYMGMSNWQKRFLILKNDKLMFYDGDTP